MELGSYPQISQIFLGVGELESWRVMELGSYPQISQIFLGVGELESWRVMELGSWGVGEFEYSGPPLGRG